jgi:hypothetical protein
MHISIVIALLITFENTTHKLLLVLLLLLTRGHHITVVVTDSGLNFAKRAAARHSSNTTAESMHFVSLHMADPDFIDSGVGNIVKLGQQPGKYSSKCQGLRSKCDGLRACAAVEVDSKTAVHNLGSHRNMQCRRSHCVLICRMYAYKTVEGQMHCVIQQHIQQIQLQVVCPSVSRDVAACV